MSTAKDNTVPATELLELQYIAHVVTRGDDAESRIQDILRYLDESGGLMRGRVMLADLPAGEIYTRYAHGLTADELEQGRYRIGEGLCGRIFEAGESALAANLDTAPGDRTLARDRLSPAQIAFIAVPIVRNYLPIGVLMVERRPDHERSAQCDLALLEVVSSMIAEVLGAETQAPAWTPPMLWNEPQPTHTAARTAAPAPAPCTRDPDNAVCDLMLRMALQRHAEGRLHLAADLYLKLAQEHCGAEQIQLAKSKLLEIAGYYETKGNPRLAADVIDRLRRALSGKVSDDARPAPFEPSDNWGDDASWSTGWNPFRDSADSGGIGARFR